jgi:Tol biopolymer transport system component
MSKVKVFAGVLVVVSLALSACSGNSNNSGNEDEQGGFSLPQSPLLAMLERKVGLIAYVGTDGNVYTVDQGGSNPVQITTDGKMQEGDFNFYEFPTWSPDGKLLAFYGLKGTSQLDLTSTLYTVDAEGKNLVEAYSSDTHVPIYLSWSPDSSKVTFISSITGGNGLVFNMVPAAGGETTVLDVGSPYYWDWLPDSSGVVVHTGGPQSLNPEARLALLTLTDGVVEDTLNLSPALFQAPALSPDGSKLLVAIEENDSNKLVVTDRLGQVEREVADLEANSVASLWSPDGNCFAYLAGDLSQGLTQGKLTFVELGEELKSVEADHDGVVAFFWSPDAKQVAYFVLVTSQPEEGENVEPGGYFFRLYVGDPATGKSNLIASYVPTQDFLRTIPYFDQYAQSSTIWSPDSQNLVVSAFLGDGTPGIFVVPASGVTDPRFLQEGTVGFWSAE